MEYRSVGGGSGSSGDDGSSDNQRRKKRYHRYTTHQIQRRVFKECSRPDEKQRLQLSRELGFAPPQFKFWFQNGRIQMKAQLERGDICALQAENDEIRCENIAIKEVLKNVICPSCGAPPVTEDSYFHEQKLLMESARLKDEVEVKPS